jgi:hypothetical protein
MDAPWKLGTPCKGWPNIDTTETWTPMYDYKDVKNPKTDVGYYCQIWKGEFWNEQQDIALACMPWPIMLKTPVTIPLPSIIYFKPTKPSKSLPTGKLWGILMTFTVFGPTRRPRGDGVVFVPSDQKKTFSPTMLDYTGLYDWAMNEENCPISMRFHSLSHAIRVLCVQPGAPFPVACNRKDGHFQALKCWKELEWKKTMEDLIKLDVKFYDLVPFPKACVPNVPQKKRRKRKNTSGKTTENFMASFDWDKVDLVVIS